ncbi:MAG: multicopper oxidase domain-containing protein [Proteobacteria bacterium]|nr:multicopper oxidase domain-containing protein [Pseudomonadota bacterium]MBU1139758.1 multicopper oxidase domain-containing protein [Pseudomonadota bacterium]
MNRQTTLKIKGAALLLFSILMLTPMVSLGLNLTAIERRWYPPNGAPSVKMWGFVEDIGYCNASQTPWAPGPALTGVVDGTLSITLRNCLSEPISLIVPGLESTLTPQTFVDSKGRTRVRAFTKEVPVDNGITRVTYTWKNLRAGTYLYQSGSHPAKQVHMGLYGALTVGRHNKATNHTILLFSEIDPALHANAEAATPLNYKPKYYLINGQSAEPAFSPPQTFGGRSEQTLHLRFLNAGLTTHVPTLQGPYMQIFAEDGNPYPYPKEQYSVLLPAGKTIDALWSPETDKLYPLYDRRLSMTTNGSAGGGMVQNLNVLKYFPWVLFTPAITHNLE